MEEHAGSFSDPSTRSDLAVTENNGFLKVLRFSPYRIYMIRRNGVDWMILTLFKAPFAISKVIKCRINRKNGSRIMSR